MTREDYISKILPTKRVLQIASVRESKPWLCTIHFYSDELGRVYWVSTKERRHSIELMDNASAVATVVIHEDTPQENYVVSITVEGRVELVKDVDIIEKIRQPYLSKLGKSASIFDQVFDPEDSLELFCLTPDKIFVFDNKNFPDNPKQEFSLR